MGRKLIRRQNCDENYVFYLVPDVFASLQTILVPLLGFHTEVTLMKSGCAKMGLIPYYGACTQIIFTRATPLLSTNKIESKKYPSSKKTACRILPVSNVSYSKNNGNRNRRSAVHWPSTVCSPSSLPLLIHSPPLGCPPSRGFPFALINEL